MLVDGKAIVLYLVFSLTKYSATITEVKGDFEKINNQLGHLKRVCLSPYSFMIQFVCVSESVDKNIWGKTCSLRSQCNNQLEQFVVNGGWSNLLGSWKKWLKNQLKWVNSVGHQHNCWVILDRKKQEVLCICCCHNCWVISDGRQQKTWNCNCWIVLNKKQQEISWDCIVSREKIKWFYLVLISGFPEQLEH